MLAHEGSVESFLATPALMVAASQLAEVLEVENAILQGGARRMNGASILSDTLGESFEPGVTLGGHWSVTEGTLCTIYDGDPSGGCYRVALVDTNCYEFYFVSRTEAAAPGPPAGKPAWTARGALQGKPSACRDQPSV